MKEQLEKRLQTLEEEYEKGQQRLEELDKEREGIRIAVLRISGAIQVLREELARASEVETTDFGGNGVKIPFADGKAVKT